MRRVVTSNSFSRGQVLLVVRMFAALLQGKDVSIYFRTPEFREVYRKFLGMQRKWEKKDEQAKSDESPDAKQG